MKYKIHVLFFLATLLLPLGSLAFIYEIKIMRKWDAARNRYHYFIGLSDFHDKTHQMNGDHLSKIEAIIRKSAPQDIKIVLEDLSSVSTTGRQACGRFIINSRGGVLGGLASTCKNMGHEVDNVEFRYCRVTSLGPVLNHLQDSVDAFPSVTVTQMNTLHQETTDIINEIKTYEDGNILKKMYEKSLEDVNKMFKMLHLDQHQSGSVAQYLKTHSTQKNRLELLKHLLTFDSALLDIRLVHSVLSAKNKSKVIAIAGGAHINRAAEMLEKIGYEQVKNSSVTFTKEHDLARCLGSHIVDGAFCVRPQPITLDFLDSVILK
jgi:hypothetical protein